MSHPPHASASASPAEHHRLRLERLRHLSRLLDNAIAIPGFNYRIGLDPILGLIPGGGDTVGLLLSSYIVFEAARMGAPQAVLGQMVTNIVLETVAGTVPVIGDLFDATWKSNARNVRLLEDHLALTLPPSTPRRRNWGFMVVFGLGLLVAIALILTLTVLMWQGLRQLLGNG